MSDEKITKEQEEKELSRGAKKRMENKQKKQKESSRSGIRYELTLGLPSIAVNSIVFFGILFLLSLLFKAGAVQESMQVTQTGGTGFFDTFAEGYYLVNPVASIFAVLLLFVVKNIYDLRFYRLQMDAKDAGKTGVRIAAWIIYILVIIWEMILTFILFMCGRTFWETYTYESSFQGDFCGTILFVLCPLCYLIQAIVRLVYRRLIKNSRNAE